MRRGQVIGTFAFLLLFVVFAAYLGKKMMGPTVRSAIEEQGTTQAVGEEQGESQDKERFAKADELTERYHTILTKGTRGLFAGHAVDEQFLVWIEKEYGEKVLDAVEEQIEDSDPGAGTEQEEPEGDIREQDEEPEQADVDIWGDNPALEYVVTPADSEEALVWREQTGKSMQVLWTEYCKRYGLETYHTAMVDDLPCAKEDTVTVDFIGDINLDDDWCTMQALSGRSNGWKDCFSGELVSELDSADLVMANNEFTFGSQGEPIEGKDYTFQAKAENVEILTGLGVDMVSLANNHSFDYGSEALLETIDVLHQAGIVTLGAGRDLDQADDARYLIADGWKIAFVTATEVERYSSYTQEATSGQPGVLKMTEPEYFLAKVQEAKANSDFVIAYVHWGQEGYSENSYAQHELAQKIADAGADVIIGGHPHRLQGVEFLGDVPVVYSLGNFWFSDASLFTAIAQITIDGNGRLGLRMIPCLQEDLTTSIIQEGELLTRYFQYIADMSTRIAADTNGRIYNLSSDDTVAARVLDALSKSDLEWYTTGHSYASHSSGYDLYGRRIDIIGNYAR